MRLGFYINPVARLRSAASTEPELAGFASAAESAGVDVILLGWTNEDFQVTERDVRLIREIVHTDLYIVCPLEQKYVQPLNTFQPDGVILVASGWDGVSIPRPFLPEIEGEYAAGIVPDLREAGLQASLFVEPKLDAIKAVARYGSTGIVLDCSTYSKAQTDEEAEQAHDSLETAVMAAQKMGMAPALANGLNYRNITPLVKFPMLDEIYIGRALVNRALIHGVDRAVTGMIDLLHRNIPVDQ